MAVYTWAGILPLPCSSQAWPPKCVVAPAIYFTWPLYLTLNSISLLNGVSKVATTCHSTHDTTNSPGQRYLISHETKSKMRCSPNPKRTGTLEPALLTPQRLTAPSHLPSTIQTTQRPSRPSTLKPPPEAKERKATLGARPTFSQQKYLRCPTAAGKLQS
jgi:hypothetical protein